VQYLQESAGLIGSLSSAVQREVYGGRVAEAAGISQDAMKLEVDRALKRRTYKEKKNQEKIDLSPARNLQPKERSIRYNNLRSARAEEMVLGQILREPALIAQIPDLKAEMFSSSYLGRAFTQLTERYRQGLQVNLGILTDFTPEEMSQIAGIVQQQGPVNERSLQDCAAVIREEYQKSQTKTEDDIMRLREKLQKSKGIKI